MSTKKNLDKQEKQSVSKQGITETQSSTDKFNKEEITKINELSNRFQENDSVVVLTNWDKNVKKGQVGTVVNFGYCDETGWLYEVEFTIEFDDGSKNDIFIAMPETNLLKLITPERFDSQDNVAVLKDWDKEIKQGRIGCILNSTCTDKLGWEFEIKFRPLTQKKLEKDILITIPEKNLIKLINVFYSY